MKKNIFLWQNIVSPHQAPYIKELAENNNVTLLVPEIISPSRKKMGWEIPDIGNINLIVNPGKNEIEQIFASATNSYNFFSCISAFPFVFKAFKISLKYIVKRGIISEQPFTFRKPLFLHIIKTAIYDYKYFPKIDYVFAIGDNAVKWYKFWNKKWRVFSFAYTVNPPVYKNCLLNVYQLNLLYVGSLIKLKNIGLVIKVLNKITPLNIKFDIIGNGQKLSKIKKLIKIYNLESNINLLGTKDNKEILKKITNYDALILPSFYDGWGAVINEALMAGCYIICSNKCGAKTLVEGNKDRGLIFKSNNISSLTNVLNECVDNIEHIRTMKKYRHNWSECISGKSVAKYFLQCISDDKKVVTPPWKMSKKS